MSGLSRSARLLALVGIMSVAVSVAPQIALAERVTATLTFVDGNGDEQPIRRATVEIWRKHGLVSVWHNDFTVTTNELGKIDFAVPASEWLGPGAVYGLRVYAINPAAIVRFLDRPQDAMYAQPGSPGAEIQRVSNSQSGTLEFSFEFTDPATIAYYNAADALLYGRDYALARQAQGQPGEPDIIKQVTVMVQSSNTFYDRYVHWLRINPSLLLAMDDLTILHEYGHFLEEQLSTFGPAIATDHDGCNAQLWPGGPHVESMDFAWMEGFSSYYAQAVARAFNTDPLKPKITGPGLGTSAVQTLERPSCPLGPAGPGPLPGEWLEDFVAGALWDLTDNESDDPFTTEPADPLCDKDKVIFSIFDRELQRVPANIQSFTDAWIKRGLDLPPLRSAFSAQGVGVRAPAPLMVFSPSAAAEPAVWRGSKGGAWSILGRPGLHLGKPGDVPVPADYDGDGQTDAAVWRPRTGEWRVRLSASGGVLQITRWGKRTDVPLPGDYDGDGETDFAFYSPSQNTVRVQNDSCGGSQSIKLSAWGIAPGTPVVGDFDGDGRDDPGTYNGVSGDMSVLIRALKPFSTPTVESVTLAGGALPAIGDYDGDYKDDLATFSPKVRPINVRNGAPGGTWTISNSATNTVVTQTWGGTLGDLPVPADYDAAASPDCDLETSPAACNTTDLAVWNNFSGNWTIRRADASARIVHLGKTGDIPIPR